MSIYFDFEVGAKGRMFRRAVESDKYDIELIWNRKHTEKLFFDVDIGSLIELSVLSICMINENKEVVGFMALADHPNILGLDPAEWETWVRNLYKRYYLSRNTLFIHFMCCIDSVSDFFIEEAFISVFMNDSYLQYIVLCVPMYCPEELITRYLTYKKRNILKYIPRSKDGIGNYLYTALRTDFCPRLRMRRAVEEDNDDIVEILDKKCPRLKELYGEYYISEIIGRHPESTRKILVADIQGRAVAVMCLNTDIDYNKLQRLYELRPFYGLKKATPVEKEQYNRTNALLAEFGHPIMLGQLSPFERPSDLKRQRLSERGRRRKERQSSSQRGSTSSKVNFMQRDSSFCEILKSQSDEGSDQVLMTYLPSPCTSVYSVTNLLEEDPFDYDIVNIDTNLLNVGEGMSCEILSTMSKTSLVVKPSMYLLNQPMMEQKELEASSHLNRNRVKRESTKKRRSKSVNLEDKGEPLNFQGAKNAFMIELVAFRDDIDDRQAYDLLEAAFELTKDYDYCIIRVPTADKTFPLLQHFCVSILLSKRKLRVREAEVPDIPQIARLMMNLDGKEIIATLEDMINKGDNQAYVFTSGMHIIGIGILEDSEQIDFIRGRFNLDSYQIHKYHLKAQGVDAGFSTLKCALVYPAFEVHFRFFAREMIRLSGCSTLLWMTAYRNKWSIHKANSLVASMVPLIPRTVEIDSAAVPELKKISVLTEKITAFTTWFIGKKITTIPKVDVNTQILIVGASRTALGFLNGLLFGQTSTYLTFNNVTMISTNGLPYMKHSKPIPESMFGNHYIYSDKYLKSVPYTYYINVIQGTMMEINLHSKFVTLTSGGRYHYDLLFLFFGKQYQHPDHMYQLLQRNYYYQYTRLDMPTNNDLEVQIANDETPENVFIINNIGDAKTAIGYVKSFACDDYKKIIVYGATIHAYLCIRALLDIKIRPENIIFIEPFPPEDVKKTRVPVFNNIYVDQTVINILESLKIKVYRSYYFKSWSLTVDNVITHADFLAYSEYIKLECNAMFYYGKPGVNLRAFIAIHKSGLAYDGGIVIDQECRTLDPYVYAAGPCTTYHKRYFAHAKNHKFYDTYEIGHKLGAQIRHKLDPLFNEAKPPFSYKWSHDYNIKTDKNIRSSISLNKDNMLHTSDYARPEMALIPLVKPKVMHCVLPGGLKYLEVRSPGLKIPHIYVQSLTYNGFVFETFKGGYFKLHLTKEFVVDGITCLCQSKYSLENFKYLYGRSATELNNVHLRYMANRLDNFFEFFRAPWAYFLYHDHIDDLFAMIKQLFPKGQSKGLTIKEALREVGVQVGCSSTFTTDTKASIQAKFVKSPHVEMVTEFLIDWLSQHEILLPMYLQPGQTAQFQYDLDSNLCF